jgi:hypothetical protein
MTDLPTHLDPAVEKTLRRLKISREDFAQAGAFITAARQHSVSKIEHEALLLSAIICYARPFGPNEKAVKGGEMHSDPTLDLSLAEFEDDDDLELHNRVILLRNKAVAHAEFSLNPIRLVADRGGFGDAAVAAMVYSVWDVRHERLDLFRFQRIAKEMQSRCVIAVHAIFAAR